jgi:quercetin dioxygenase-like cupin family protein
MLFAAITLAQSTQPSSDISNDRVKVMQADLRKGGKLPSSNKYDSMTVQLADADASLNTPGKLAKNRPARTGEIHYFPAGSSQTLVVAGEKPVPFVEVQFLRPPGKYVPLEIPATHYCNPDAPKACVTEQYMFCTDRFCVETVKMDPGAISTQHTHDSDHMVMSTSEFRWREESPGQSPAEFSFKVGQSKYGRAGITHRLVNVGATTAQMVVVQFK